MSLCILYLKCTSAWTITPHIKYSILNTLKDYYVTKAIAWKRSKMSCLPEDKAAYKAVASKCSGAIKKYHAA